MNYEHINSGIQLLKNLYTWNIKAHFNVFDDRKYFCYSEEARHSYYSRYKVPLELFGKCSASFICKNTQINGAKLNWLFIKASLFLEINIFSFLLRHVACNMFHITNTLIESLKFNSGNRSIVILREIYYLLCFIYA